MQRPWCAVLALLATAPRRFLCEESCPAGASSASCRPGGAGATVEAAAPVGAGQAHQEEAQKAELLAQEIAELEGFIQMGEDRIGLLKELRATLGSGHADPADTSVRALRETLPLLSEVPVDAHTSPVAISEDFLVSKAVLPQDEPVGLVKFLPLRSPRSSSSSSSKNQVEMPSALLIAAQSDGIVRLYTPPGHLVLEFATGHDHPVTQLASSLSHDEYLVVTGDTGGVVRVHKISVRARRLTKDQKKARRASMDEKVSQYLNAEVNVTAQLQRQMQLPADGEGNIPPMTSLVMASQGGTKYFVAGDSAGQVSVFTKNGTLRAQLDVGESGRGGVLSLHSQLSSVLFRAEGQWGYIDMEKMVPRPVSCPQLDGRVVAAVLDSQMASRAILADEAGTISVYSVKNKKDCSLELRFEAAAGVRSESVELASVRGFALALQQVEGQALVTALNVSQAGKRAGDLSLLPKSVVWRRNRQPARAWTVHKRYQQGDLIAFLSEDGTEIEIMELLMVVHTPPNRSGMDSFSDFKMPVIGVAIVLVLGYQFLKNGGKLGVGKKAGGLGNRDFRSVLNKRKGGIGGLGRRHR